jgi:nicotinamidase-related amidase
MAGVATNSVVLTSVACAADMGYEVVVIADACSSGRPDLHASSLENMTLVAEVVTLNHLAKIVG